MPCPSTVDITWKPSLKREHLRPRHQDAIQRSGPPLVSLLQRHDSIERLQQSGIGLSRGPEPDGPGIPLSPLTRRRKEQLLDQREATGPEPVQPLLDTPRDIPRLLGCCVLRALVSNAPHSRLPFR
eukprot:1759129-Rhodomonas_salina.1